MARACLNYCFFICVCRLDWIYSNKILVIKTFERTFASTTIGIKMVFEFWLQVAAIIFLFVTPLILKRINKRKVTSNVGDLNEVQVKYREFDPSENIQPFSKLLLLKKGTLRITQREVYCDHISISVKDISKAICYQPTESSYKDSISILRLNTKYRIYDFSISPFALEVMKMPFDLISEEASFISKKINIIIGIIIIGIIALVLFGVI